MIKRLSQLCILFEDGFVLVCSMNAHALSIEITVGLVRLWVFEARKQMGRCMVKGLENLENTRCWIVRVDSDLSGLTYYSLSFHVNINLRETTWSLAVLN